MVPSDCSVSELGPLTVRSGTFDNDLAGLELARLLAVALEPGLGLLLGVGLSKVDVGPAGDVGPGSTGPIRGWASSVTPSNEATARKAANAAAPLRRRWRSRTVRRTASGPGGFTARTVSAWKRSSRWLSDSFVGIGHLLGHAENPAERSPATEQPGLDRVLGHAALGSDLRYGYATEVVQDHGPPMVGRQCGECTADVNPLRTDLRLNLLSLSCHE